MLPHVIEARYVTGYTVWLRFSDGAGGEVDLSKELHGPIFEPLKDIGLFRLSLFTRNWRLWCGRTERTLRPSSCAQQSGLPPNSAFVTDACAAALRLLQRGTTRTLGLAMTTVMNPAADPERLAFPRLLVRSLILGSVVPVTQGEFWDVNVVQIVLALVLCIVLYGVEKAVLYPFQKHMTIRPLHAAAYRGALLYGLLIFGFTGDWAQSLGAGLGGALFAMLLFWLEGGALKLIYRTPSSSSLR